MINVKIKRLADDVMLPKQQTPGSAGYDLHAYISDKTVLYPGQRILVPTGIALEIPKGFEGQIRPRSGIAIRNGITVINSPGTIDSDYRGEILIGLINLGHDVYTISPGDRIAQLIIAPVQRFALVEVEHVNATERNTNGFGSTGR